MDALSKMRKAGLTLPSVEGVNILRDPPKSIHTRKKERIEAGDVTYNLREMPDRYSEAIRYYPTGVNPSVSVSYNNSGGGSKTHTLPNVQATNPYKVVKDGAFRPPEFRQEDLLPLSRQKRMWTTAQTRATPGFQSKTVQERTIDSGKVMTAVLPKTVKNLGGVNVETDAHNYVLNPLLYSAVTALKGTSGTTAYEIETYRDASKYTVDKPLTSYMTTPYTLKVYDHTTRTMSDVILPQKELDDIMVEAAKGGFIQLDGPSGQVIKLKDYNWSVYQTPKNTNVVVLETYDPDVELKRNIPLTAVNAITRMRTWGNPRPLAPMLNHNRPIVSAFASPIINNSLTAINNGDYTLTNNMPSVSAAAVYSDNNIYIPRDDDERQLSYSMPNVSAQTSRGFNNTVTQQGGYTLNDRHLDVDPYNPRPSITTPIRMELTPKLTRGVGR